MDYETYVADRLDDAAEQYDNELLESSFIDDTAMTDPVVTAQRLDVDLAQALPVPVSVPIKIVEAATPTEAEAAELYDREVRELCDANWLEEVDLTDQVVVLAAPVGMPQPMPAEEVVDIAVKGYVEHLAPKAFDAIVCTPSGTTTGQRREPVSPDDGIRLKAANAWVQLFGLPAL